MINRVHIPRFYRLVIALWLVLCAAVALLVFAGHSQTDSVACLTNLQRNPDEIDKYIVDTQSGAVFVRTVLRPPNAGLVLEGTDRLSIAFISDEQGLPTALIAVHNNTFQRRILPVQNDYVGLGLSADAQYWDEISNDKTSFIIYSLFTERHKTEWRWDIPITGNLGNVSWSLNGHQIIYAAVDDNQEISLGLLNPDDQTHVTIPVKIRADTSTLQPQFVWSPDSEYVAVNASGYVGLLNVRTHQYHEFVSIEKQREIQLASNEVPLFSWQPNGHKLIYATRKESNIFNLVVYNPDDQITKVIAKNISNFTFVSNPDSSYNGQYLLTTRPVKQNDSSTELAYQLMLVDLSTGDEFSILPHRVADVNDPDFINTLAINTVVNHTFSVMFQDGSIQKIVWTNLDPSQQQSPHQFVYPLTGHFSSVTHQNKWSVYTIATYTTDKSNFPVEMTQINLINNDTGVKQELTNQYINLLSSTISPDGRVLATASFPPDNPSTVEIEFKGTEAQWSHSFPIPYGQAEQMAWSPDSQQLAVFIKNPTTGNNTLYLLRPDGSLVRVIKIPDDSGSNYQWTTCGIHSQDE